MANEIRGFEPKVVINGTTWDVKEGEPNEDIETARGDTTATAEFKSNVVTKREFQITLKALRYRTLNPHITPLYIAPTSLNSTSATWPRALKYFPTGDTTDDTTAWRANMVWTQYSESFNAETGLVTLNAKGISDGSYKRPGDV